MAVSGSCLCGVVRFEIHADFEHFYICHCSYCQKDTGSAFAANLFVKRSALNWLSGQENVRSYTHKGTRHVKSFCSECGSALPNTEMGGDVCLVPAGSLNVKPPIKPEAHIFADSKASWEEQLAEAECFSGFPE